jgi:hypothetical protein
MLSDKVTYIFYLFISSVVFVTRSHKNPWHKPARELPCENIRILLRNRYLIIFIYALMIHGSFIEFVLC